MDTATFRNPRLVALILLVIISAGLSALLSLGRQEDPTITNINAVVTTPYPGADPARVEALVTRKLEDELREIAEIEILTSTSSTGLSVVQIELAETVDPAIIESVWTDVRDAMEDAARSFPADAGTPVFDDTYGAFAAIAALVPLRESVSPAVQGRYAEELADLMRAVPGTKDVELFGLPEEEVLVQLDPAATAALGLTAADVSAAIRAADAARGRLRLLRRSAPGAGRGARPFRRRRTGAGGRAGAGIPPDPLRQRGGAAAGRTAACGAYRGRGPDLQPRRAGPGRAFPRCGLRRCGGLRHRAGSGDLGKRPGPVRVQPRAFGRCAADG
nr:efflux RND transporter permease subunit [Mangrovicoccus ximenensis]